ncbi:MULTISPECIES: hypothetical protein [Rhizobium]|jgi:hypothetical protein|uniref:Uncharacterized protein n=1 Tax=Rhizobium rhizoryzae TaxID=451876 RepID=A0A7W6PTG5_9HYPH|nr:MULTISPECIES: hypothetical protein [Rhizobium]MBB4145167.1 hypothetical protein [Rhizobium rhizoryzae]
MLTPVILSDAHATSLVAQNQQHTIRARPRLDAYGVDAEKIEA